MFKFLKRDPVEQAKKHIEKALDELEHGYADYASAEYERAAQMFKDADQADFAIKYFREAAYCALERDDHTRAAEMKIRAAEVLVGEGRFEEASGLYSEASDHYFRQKNTQESSRALSMAVFSSLAARSFDTATNICRKGEKRSTGPKSSDRGVHELAEVCVRILCEGATLTESELQSALDRFRPRDSEAPLIDFVTTSVRLALKTEVSLEWAGPKAERAMVKTPLEFEFRYRCPVPVRVVAHKYALSNGLKLTSEPFLTKEPTPEDSWLIGVLPVLSGEGQVGPFSITLEGERVLVNKQSNVIRFTIADAPAKLSVDISPARLKSNLNDEMVFDVTLSNSGNGPAASLTVSLMMTPGLAMSVGTSEKVIQSLGVGEKMRIQFFVKGVAAGNERLTVWVRDDSGVVDTKVSAEIQVV
ncbi:MAG: hypothetical protein HXY34_05385 [Candidatus Thorarchaeota archaeon]|nr:hypothetical protein [Candidatus Thorarchaeota archaeon]